MSAGQGSIHIERNSEQDIKMRDLYVVVDDLPEKTLLFGESLEVPLSPGDHRVKVSNHLYRDNAVFRVSEGEAVRFEAVNVMKPGILNVVAFISGGVMYRPVLRRL